MSTFHNLFSPMAQVISGATVGEAAEICAVGDEGCNSVENIHGVLAHAVRRLLSHGSRRSIGVCSSHQSMGVWRRVKGDRKGEDVQYFYTGEDLNPVRLS
jgi:hypothetical protein